MSATARAARVEAQRVRIQSQELRLAVRGNLARSREHLGRAQNESDKALARRLEPLPSPWSELRWRQTYETLDQTLVQLN